MGKSDGKKNFVKKHKFFLSANGKKKKKKKGGGGLLTLY